MGETMFLRERKERDYTVVNNTYIKDTRLSWQSKGVMTYLLSLPEDWVIHMEEIQQHASNGRDSLRSAIRELKQYGYLEQHQEKKNGRFSSCVYKIIENPMTDKQQTETTDAGNTSTGNPSTENPTLLNTNKQSTDKQSTKKQSTKKQNTEKTGKQPTDFSVYSKQFYDKYLANYERLHQRGLVANPTPAINYRIISKQLQRAFEIYGYEQVVNAVDSSFNDSWIISIGYPINVILADKMLPKYINGFVPQTKQQAFTGEHDYTSEF